MWFPVFRWCLGSTEAFTVSHPKVSCCIWQPPALLSVCHTLSYGQCLLSCFLGQEAEIQRRWMPFPRTTSQVALTLPWYWCKAEEERLVFLGFSWRCSDLCSAGDGAQVPSMLVKCSVDKLLSQALVFWHRSKLDSDSAFQAGPKLLPVLHLDLQSAGIMCAPQCLAVLFLKHL